MPLGAVTGGAGDRPCGRLGGACLMALLKYPAIATGTAVGGLGDDFVGGLVGNNNEYVYNSGATGTAVGGLW